MLMRSFAFPRIFFDKADDTGGTATAEVPPERAAEVASDEEKAGNPFWEKDEEPMPDEEVARLAHQTLAEGREKAESDAEEPVDHGDAKVKKRHRKQKDRPADDKPDEAADDTSVGDKSTDDDEAEPPADDAESPSLDPEAVQLARDIGLTEEEISGHATDQQLLTTLRAIARRSEPAPKPAEKADAAADSVSDEAPTIDTGDPDLDKQFNAILKAQHEQIQALKSVHQQSTEQQRSAEIEAHTARFESTVRNLGEDWEEVYGKGDVRTLKRGSAKHTARVAAYQHYAALEPLHPDKTPQQLIEMVNRALHGDHMEKQLRKRLSAEVEKQSKGATPVPRGKPQGRPLTADERLIAIHDRFQKAPE